MKRICCNKMVTDILILDAENVILVEGDFENL